MSTARKFTVLCVDDDKTALHVRKLVLESAGYTVLAAEDAETALQLFLSSDIDVVLSDYLLGRGTLGAQLAAEMKRLRPNVPVVILSGVAELPQGKEHTDLFFTKPESPVQLLQTLSTLLGG